MSSIYNLQEGESPLLVSVPHAGTQIPTSLLTRFHPSARSVPDTDWFVDRLYDWVPDLGGTLISATHSRYVIDVNRPPDDQPLYDTATTGLIPKIQFDGAPIYSVGSPDSAEVASRRAQFYQPYHDELIAQLGRIKSQHGFAILFDAHSIKSRVPRLFDGQLPDLNLGTFSRRSACDALIEIALQQIGQAEGFTHVVDGRFRGGYITRHYGCPSENVHALQLELSQRTYMDEETAEYAVQRSAPLVGTLRKLVAALLDWRP